MAVMADYRDLCHDWDARVAPEFVKHEHVRSPHKFQRRRPLQRLLKHGVDTVLGIAHGLLRAAAKTVENDAAVGRRGASGLHDLLGAGTQVDYTSFKFFLAQALGRASGGDYGLNAELAEALGKQIARRLFQVNQRSASRHLLGGGSGRQRRGGAEGSFHSQPDRFPSTKGYCGVPLSGWKDPKGQAGGTKVSLP